ncbi:MAG: 50S ribosomal protein L11 methyltransferase [Alphaproteobacteria bacterium]|nr:50S ribosomal protein L11 methyltransferase [Alphaproteobacteria bacterium]
MPSQTKPITYKLSFTTARPDAAETALEDFGAHVWATEKADHNDTRFEVYFDTHPNIRAPDMRALNLPPDAIPLLEKLPNKDWVAESQEGLPPVIVPPFYVHGRHDAPPGGGWRNIEIQAATAFGSGHHGTTQGCLVLLSDYLKRHKPRHIADIGCGTGVLAIAAAKTGCSQIMASDIDPEAIRVARHNMRLNKVAPYITCFPSVGMAHRHYQARRFDLIVANILAGPLRQLAGDFNRHLSHGGRVIIAGILNEQARQVIARYRAEDLIVERKIIIGAWTSLCFRQ